MADAGSKSCEHFDHGHKRLERFQAKWKPVRVKKTRQIKARAPLRFYRSGKGSRRMEPRRYFCRKLICLAVDRELRGGAVVLAALIRGCTGQKSSSSIVACPEVSLMRVRTSRIDGNRPTIIGRESDATMQPTLSDNRHARHCAAMLVRTPRSQMSVRSSEASISKRDPMTFSEASWRSLL